MAIQETAYAKKLSALKPTLFRMWGPQIALLLAGQPYEIVEDECAPK